MTPNCANTISNMRKVRQEIPLQGEELCNSGKLRKVVAIYKTNTLALSKEYITLKSRGSEKVPYSKVVVPDLFSVNN